MIQSIHRQGFVCAWEGVYVGIEAKKGMEDDYFGTLAGC